MPPNEQACHTGPALESLLGDRIQTTALDVLEALIDATYSRDRDAALAHANLRIEKLCLFFFRLATALKYLDLRRDAHAALFRLPPQAPNRRTNGIPPHTASPLPS